MDATQLTQPHAHHGEGPVWSPAWGGLKWVDMLAGDVLSLDERTGAIGRWHAGAVAAVVRPRASGGMVVALERALLLVDADGSSRKLDDLWTDPSVRLNEGGCDPGGRFYCGSMAYDLSPGRGALYRVAADHTVAVVLDSVTISNGLAWSPDGTRAYYADTATQRVDVFDYEPDGELTHRRPFVEVPPDAGGPDGLTVDEDGCVWVALWGGAAVRRYRPDGRLDGVLALPVTNVTACAFGGSDLSTLYVTTSRLGIDPKAEPAAGAVFCADVGVRGLPVVSYAG